MKISYNWLRNYINTELAPNEIAKILTYIGLEVEALHAFSSLPGGLDGLVVGEVLSCQKHPNADRLHTTIVRISPTEELPIVCGAPNVAAGQKVVVAPVGVTIHAIDGQTMTIKKANLRGEKSEGMICAEDEIGLGSSHDGIMVLPAETPVGTPLADLYPDHCDSIFEIGLTANRADAMSHYGVARDLAAYLNQSMPTKAIMPTHEIKTSGPSSKQVQLGEIDPNGCIRYAGITIKNVKIAPSPEWLRNALRAIGLNPINNVVDITNYVLHELGQPLHAFDLKAFPTARVNVTFPKKNTKFIALDEKERLLSGLDLAICHNDEPLCLAGILGGIDSGVTQNTTDIFLESAVFDPVKIRKTAKRHGLNTDASFRFERGMDPAFTIPALKRAASLIVDIAGGQIEGDIIDFYPTPLEHAPFEFDSKRAQMVMGVELTRMELETLFESLEIDYRPIGAGKYELHVPYYRVDVTRAEDVIEDLLRLYGYDRVPTPEVMTIALPTTQASPEAERKSIMSSRLVGAGYYEIMCNSLRSKMHYSTIDAYPEKTLVEILNPLSNELNILRPSLLLGGLETIARNISHQRANLKLFEFGHVYSKNDKKSTPEQPLKPYMETQHLALFMCGSNHEDIWRESATPMSVFDLKGQMEALLLEASVPLNQCQYHQPPAGLYETGLSIKHKKGEIAHFGIVREELCEIYGIKIPVYAAEINWAILQDFWDEKKPIFTEIPKFPEVRRDLALLIDKSIEYAAIEKIAFKQEGKLLQRMQLFDVYEGDKLPDGKKSYAVMFILQDKDKTLNDKTIDKCMRNLTAAFGRELGATLR